MALKNDWVNGQTVDDTAMNDVADAVNTLSVVPTAVKTSAYAAAVGDLVPADATSGGFTVTLPDAPADESRIVVKKLDASVNVVTVQRSGSDTFNIAAGATTLQLVLQDQTVAVQYQSSSGIWYVTSHGAAIASWDARYRMASTPVTGGLLPAQVVTLGDETYTITSGSVTQINGTTIQGYTPAIGDRVLIVTAPAASGVGSSYTNTSQPGNGVYVVTGNTTNLSVARAADMTDSVNPAGLMCYAENGSSWGGQLLWGVTVPGSAATHTYGSGNIMWAPFGGVRPFWDGIALNTNTNPITIWNGSGTTVLQATGSAGNQTLTLPTGTATLGGKVAVPSTATSAGTVGQWAADATYFYVCTSTNVWRRASVASW